MKKSHIIPFIALAGVVVVLLVVGILIQNEPGLRNPDSFWPKNEFPLLVEVDAYSVATPSPEEVKRARTAVSNAVTAANQQLGFTAFKVVGLVPKNHIFIQVGAPQELSVEEGVSLEEAGGVAVLEKTHGSKFWEKCFIQTSNTGEYLENVLLHELGHCLDLAHDEHKGSIMYPHQGAYSGFPPSFSDHDRKILRDRYAP